MTPRVAFPGAPGAFSEDAVLRYFGSNVVAQPTAGFAATLSALRDGSVDYCVLPVANSIAGPVTEAQGAVAASPWATAVGETTIHVRQCLLGLEHAGMDSIARALSHPVALAQCRSFFQTHPWVEPGQCSDTATAARLVASGGDRRTAAIASARAAAIYGLAVLATDIQDAGENLTRFVVLASE